MDQAQLDAEADDWERYYSSPELPASGAEVTQAEEDVHPSAACTCTNNCTLRCACRKFGSGCSTSCHCAGSWQCKNQLNDLAVLFGVGPNLENPLRATPCFTRYLAGKKGPDLKTIDTEILRRKLMRLKATAGDDIPKGEVFHEEGFDDTIRAWKDRWVAGFQNDAERTAHIRTLFKYGLGTEDNGDGYRRFFFSFCRDGWEQSNCTWHCRACGDCKDWREWRCSRCNECSDSLNNPCQECGGVSHSYDPRERYEM